MRDAGSVWEYLGLIEKGRVREQHPCLVTWALSIPFQEASVSITSSRCWGLLQGLQKSYLNTNGLASIPEEG